MDENAFTYNGIEYVTIDKDYCDGCAFFTANETCTAPRNIPNCYPRGRRDSGNVIFVEKQP